MSVYGRDIELRPAYRCVIPWESVSKNCGINIYLTLKFSNNAYRYMHGCKLVSTIGNDESYVLHTGPWPGCCKSQQRRSWNQLAWGPLQILPEIRLPRHEWSCLQSYYYDCGSHTRGLNAPILEPRWMMHFERLVREGCLSHSLPSSYVPRRPWHETYLNSGTWASVRSSSLRDRSKAKYWIGFWSSSKACRSKQTFRRFLSRR